jgi:hypothetical protein
MGGKLQYGTFSNRYVGTYEKEKWKTSIVTNYDAIMDVVSIIDS